MKAIIYTIVVLLAFSFIIGAGCLEQPEEAKQPSHVSNQKPTASDTGSSNELEGTNGNSETSSGETTGNAGEGSAGTNEGSTNMPNIYDISKEGKMLHCTLDVTGEEGTGKYDVYSYYDSSTGKYYTGGSIVGKDAMTGKETVVRTVSIEYSEGNTLYEKTYLKGQAFGEGLNCDWLEMDSNSSLEGEDFEAYINENADEFDVDISQQLDEGQKGSVSCEVVPYDSSVFKIDGKVCSQEDFYGNMGNIDTEISLP